MSATALIYHPDFRNIESAKEHPERPQRITEVIQRIKASTFASDIQWIQAEEADDDPILLNHTTQHVDWVSNLTSTAQISPVSADTHACPETPRIVRFGVGSVIKAIDMVMAGKAKNAFCAVRPPDIMLNPTEQWGFAFLTTWLSVHTTYASSMP